MLDLPDTEYASVSENIVKLCPTIEWNKAYKNGNWIADVRRPKNKNITIVNIITPDEKLYCSYEARLGASMTKTLVDFFYQFVCY